MGRIIIIAGPPGAGKTTIASRLARRSDAPLSLHLHTDDFPNYVRKGFVAPWRPEASHQNLVMAHATAATAVICARAGYEVYADGVVSARSLPVWRQAAQDQALELRYVVLLPNEATAVARAEARRGPKAMNDGEVARLVWRRFTETPPPPACVLDTSAHEIDDTVAAVQAGLAQGRFRLS